MTDAAEVGEALMRARLALGLSLEEAAQQLKFSARQLGALERGEVGALDAVQGGAFLRGMVRGYARLVKVDPAPLLQRIAGRVALPDTDRLAARFRQPVPFSDGARRTNLMYVSLSVALLAIVGFVVFEWRQDGGRPPQLTVKRAAPAPRPVAPGAPQAEPAPAPLATPVAATAPDLGPPAGQRRIVLYFDQESWVEIKDGRGRTLMSQLNPAGSERAVDGTPPFSVVIGNAQFVRLNYDRNAIDLAPYVRVEVARLSLE